jgi:hypothetical protein
MLTLALNAAIVGREGDLKSFYETFLLNLVVLDSVL